MDWFMVLSGTAFAILFPSFFLWRRRQRIRSGKQRKPEYKNLSQRCDAFLFMAEFFALWIFFVAPYWEWTFFKHSKIIIIVFAVGTGELIAWLLHRADRSDDAQ